MSEATIYLDGRAKARDEVLQQAMRAATGFDKMGIREGDTVASLLRNDFSFFEVQQAAAAVGAYSVPLNWHGKTEELTYILNDAKPKVLVAHADLLEPLRPHIPQGLQVLVVPTPPEVQSRYGISDALATPKAGDIGWPEWCQTFELWTQPPKRGRATMIYTSGTTGHPKGVKRDPATPEQAKAYVDIIERVYGLTPGVRALITGPLYHASPNAYGRQAITAADVLVLQSKFDPEETLAAIEKYRITNAVMVPTMFIRILKLPKEVRERYDVSSLKWVTHTGAPCPREVKQELMEWWGPVVYETYGGTEVGTATLATPDDWLNHPGSVGVPTPGTQIAFFGEDGKPVEDGTPGEIYMRVPAYADFTYLNHEEKRKSVERDGLISVGDVGYLKEGRLYLCDRRSDMVISGGTNIYPAEIEMVLTQCPGVHDCAVFGIPDEDFGESLAAAVELMPGAELSASDIQKYLESHLAKYKVPRRIDFHASLPREDSGKIFKRRLRDPFWQAVGRKI
ncbi:acyl-CoA synthetase [Cupriavidus metallidurans]|uniref:AMP-dependent synthetase and ligase putative o-succinylbenzoate-CoA ligase n=1 Tax=Cupriavidus metallidurans (strain ATCC 43123 / DSM 2839 / NBRC 102507 / CH34) TaxID=266264 RepID=Q1LBT9_CUPMC|nr:acyl-CoA synthetase [Cupriavidus metallidurans]ABF12387.1 AMP-dependent synthetase and ligase; putative o-succinylbenzoate-CoA ligase [Cupriavidus metallidurans CH34]QGS32383.1 AMP-binding protein [Cupriavidus metallidurans]